MENYCFVSNGIRLLDSTNLEEPIESFYFCLSSFVSNIKSVQRFSMWKGRRFQVLRPGLLTVSFSLSELQKKKEKLRHLTSIPWFCHFFFPTNFPLIVQHLHTPTLVFTPWCIYTELVKPMHSLLLLVRKRWLNPERTVMWSQPQPLAPPPPTPTS